MDGIPCFVVGATAGAVTLGTLGAEYGAMGGTIVEPGGGTIAGAASVGALGVVAGALTGGVAGGLEDVADVSHTVITAAKGLEHHVLNAIKWKVRVAIWGLAGTLSLGGHATDQVKGGNPTAKPGCAGARSN